MPFHGPVIPFGAMVDYCPVSAKDQSRLHPFGPKTFTRNIPWKGDILIADIEELVQTDASEIHARRLNA